MATLFPFLTPAEFVLVLAVAAIAGTIKGLVGFAMPMILIAGMSSFLSPELALAGLILPTVVTNLLQALSQGWRAAAGSIRRFGVFLAVGGVFLFTSAQLVRAVEPRVFFLGIGGVVSFFALIQLLGLRLRLAAPRLWIEAVAGAVAGFVGGMSGVWGPPTVMYLTALDTPKAEQMRIQGVIYGLGSVALLAAHVGSGVLSARTVPFSLALVVPALLGMWVGGRLRNRTDQAAFRRLTLLVLLVVGLNLVRRGLAV